MSNDTWLWIALAAWYLTVEPVDFSSSVCSALINVLQLCSSCRCLQGTCSTYRQGQLHTSPLGAVSRHQQCVSIEVLGDLFMVTLTIPLIGQPEACKSTTTGRVVNGSTEMETTNNRTLCTWVTEIVTPLSSVTITLFYCLRQGHF